MSGKTILTEAMRPCCVDEQKTEALIWNNQIIHLPTRK